MLNLSINEQIILQAGIVLFALIITVGVIFRLIHGYREMEDVLRDAVYEEVAVDHESDEDEEMESDDQ